MPNEPHFVVCPCQNCNGHIEFDASDFAKGETRQAECPHCHMETTIFAPHLVSGFEPQVISSNTRRSKSPNLLKVLWSITAVLFVVSVVLVVTIADEGLQSIIVVFFLGFLIAVAIYTGVYRNRSSASKAKPPLLPNQPQISRPQSAIPQGLKCPFCGYEKDFTATKELNTEGWITLLVGLILAPVCIGILLFFLAFTFKDQKYVCGNCHKKF